MMLVTTLIFSALADPCHVSVLAGRKRNIPQSLLSFWQGRWKMNGVHSTGEQFSARNEVKVLQHGQILQEDIILLDKNQLRGRGLTKYRPSNGTWHHSYQNNAGDYMEFIGEFDLHQRQFVTRVRSISEGSKLQRIQLHSCCRQAYQWLWQELDTEQNIWYTSWHIDYRKLSRN